jgi:hypothetical protein
MPAWLWAVIGLVALNLLIGLAMYIFGEDE